MKLVREHINEKFSQESDPIKDLGIGRMSFWIKKFKEKGQHTSVEGSFAYFGDLKHAHESFAIYLILKNIVINNVEDYHDIKTIVHEVMLNRYLKGEKINKKDLYDALKKHLYIDMYEKESLDEKFTQESDPIKDLNIGINAKKYKDLNLNNRYTGASKKETQYILDFFKTSKNNIFYLGCYNYIRTNEFFKFIENFINEKTTQKTVVKEFSDKAAGNQTFCGFVTSYGKISVTSQKNNLTKWYLCDLSIIVLLDTKFDISKI